MKTLPPNGWSLFVHMHNTSSTHASMVQFAIGASSHMIRDAHLKSSALPCSGFINDTKNLLFSLMGICMEKNISKHWKGVTREVYIP